MKTKRVKNYLCRIFIANVVDVNTFKEFEDILRDVFLWGSNKKFIFVNDKTRKQIEPFIEEYIKRDANIYDSKFGTMKLACADGTVTDGELLFVDEDFYPKATF